MTTMLNTTRGVSHDPVQARKEREDAQALAQAAVTAEAQEIERQVRTCYAEHMPGQRRWLGAQRAGVLTRVA